MLQALLSKMTAARGAVAVTGGPVAYVPQSPWVQNLSLRDNITFGLPYDAAKYRAVVHACALELDLRILPQGDATLAGERGINLSGGQRQRLALARAAYHDAGAFAATCCCCCSCLLLFPPLGTRGASCSAFFRPHSPSPRPTTTANC